MTETTPIQRRVWYKRWWVWVIAGAFIIAGGIGVALKPAPTVAVAVSPECANAIEAFGNVPASDLDGEAKALTTTTQACATAEEYLMAVHANPASWYYKSSNAVKDDLVLMSACTDNMTQPMCVDAKRKALIK